MPSIARLKRLDALEARLLRPAFKPFPFAAAAASLRELLALLTTGKICLVPQPALDPTPAMLAAHAALDRIAGHLEAEKRKAAEEKRQAKLERRAARRARAALQRPEPVPALEHGQPENAA
jgi:hypothetical protein